MNKKMFLVLIFSSSLVFCSDSDNSFDSHFFEEVDSSRDLTLPIQKNTGAQNFDFSSNSEIKNGRRFGSDIATNGSIGFRSTLSNGSAENSNNNGNNDDNDYKNPFEQNFFNDYASQGNNNNNLNLQNINSSLNNSPKLQASAGNTSHSNLNFRFKHVQNYGAQATASTQVENQENRLNLGSSALQPLQRQQKRFLTRGNNTTGSHVANNNDDDDVYKEEPTEVACFDQSNDNNTGKPGYGFSLNRIQQPVNNESPAFHDINTNMGFNHKDKESLGDHNLDKNTESEPVNVYLPLFASEGRSLSPVHREEPLSVLTASLRSVLTASLSPNNQQETKPCSPLVKFSDGTRSFIVQSIP